LDIHNEIYVCPQITCYRAVLLRVLNRMWAWITNLKLPTSFRPWVHNYYTSAFGCDLQEAAHENLTAHKGLAEFFSRLLKDCVHPVDKVDFIVSNLLSFI
jgi:phosphatidylserine decarboxylase